MKHSHITIGYVQSKLIKTPLHLNVEWNAKVNACNTVDELFKLAEADDWSAMYRAHLTALRFENQNK